MSYKAALPKHLLWYNKLMLSAKIITKHLMKNDRKADILHSSGYARVQNGQGLGAAGADDFATRKTLDSQRKYIQKYKNSRIMNSYYGPQRARTMEAQVGRNSTGLRSAEVNSRRGRNFEM